MHFDRYSFRPISSRPWQISWPWLLLRATLLTTMLVAATEQAIAYEEAAQIETVQPALFALPVQTKTSDNRERQEDEILLINTRELGTVCDQDQMSQKLRCERYISHDSNNQSWLPIALDEVFAKCKDRMPTIIYVHGNRVARGVDRAHGLMVYHSLIKRGHPTKPIRFIIWSWPSTQVSGTLQDYRVKAARTRPVGWQLAWMVDRMPAKTHLSLVGYSYGARVVSGALHLLGGGQLNGLELRERIHPDRLPMKAIYVAAAFDVQWMQPGGYHGNALSQIDRLMLVNNRHDPAMRFFHFSSKRHRVRALGWAGLSNKSRLGNMAGRIQSFDVTRQVGRTHALAEYLAASRPMNQVWQQLCDVQPRADTLATLPMVTSQGPVAIQPAMAGREAISDHQ